MAGGITNVPQTGPYKETPRTIKPGDSNSSLDKDMFLKLLVAQLKYQDPMKPTDSSALMQQSATYSMVESMQAMQATSVKNASQIEDTNAAAMIGKNITALASDDVTVVSGLVTGVRFTADGPVLKVGNKDVPLSRVTAVNQASSN